MNLVDRAKNLLLTPKTEWAAIDAETHTVQDLYTGYVMILAAIPPVATFIGLTLIGMGIRMPITVGVVHLILTYVLSLASVYVIALIIDALAPNFGGQKNFMQAFKVAAFAPTASWVAGVLYIIPVLGILAILGGLYSLYLLYLGLPRLMKTPDDKAAVYTVVVILVVIVLYVVIGAVAALSMPGSIRGF